MSTKKITVIFISLLITLISGCGYKIGSIMHPQVKSIAIAPITNETLEPMAAAYMRQSLCEQFQFDSSLKVKNLEEADCVLYGRVIDIKVSASVNDTYDLEQTYIPAESSVSVAFEFTIIIPGQAKPLINKRQVSGSASFQVMADQDITRRRGIQQACRNAAQEAVTYTVEAW